jgi:hypothetical protein
MGDELSRERRGRKRQRGGNPGATVESVPRPLVPVTRDTLASPSVTHLIDDSVPRATPLGVPAQSVVGGPVDARLPLALLEAVKAIDTPEAELGAELVHELRNKRLGLSDTVLQQIRRYQDAVRRQQRVSFDEVIALARLIGRRPDADLAFRESGRRWARAQIATIGSTRRNAAPSLPALLGRPLRCASFATSPAASWAQLWCAGSTLLLEVPAPAWSTRPRRVPVAACTRPRFVKRCRCWRTRMAGEHVLCRSRGTPSASGASGGMSPFVSHRESAC